MADDINSSASFGQKNDDAEELPIIVAQRFLNIFRQLHIFSNERREAFNKMLLELPPEVKNIFQTLPGGTPLQEYMEDVEQKSKGLEPSGHHEHKKSTTILQDAMQHQEVPVASSGGAGVAIGGDFAKILANSLAQSNAEIIKELQNSRPAVAGTEGVVANGAMKLVADESFTNIISKALAEAIENSEKKRLEDNKIIANSFMELQENLSKLIEQNGQVKFVTDDNGETKAVSAMPMKGIVDDLVKAQSEFLKETSKNQKEELASIISTAIQESQKLSTQTLIESLKQMGDGQSPAPITYAAASPKGTASMETVEQALKAQGKEFSSIISTALKESQKNSAQTIAETLESIKRDSSVAGGQNNLKVEEIMRMQANLFRDIARAQNQEFSALISSALKESQRQSTEAIIAALSKLPNLPVQTVAVPVPMNVSSLSSETEKKDFEPITLKSEAQPAIITSSAAPVEDTPFINKYINDDLSQNEDEQKPEVSEVLFSDEPQKKKKKKKKKKNKENITEASIESRTASDEEESVAKSNDINASKADDTTEKESTKQETALSQDKSAQKEDKTKEVSEIVQTEETPIIEKNTIAPTRSAQSMLERLMTISTAFSAADDIKEEEDDTDWGWGTSVEEKKDTYTSADTYANFDVSPESETSYYAEASSASSDNEQDWEWEYEEVPADAEGYGEEGQDWEWEYEEVPADAEGYGEEGQDWEWEYEEVPAEAEGYEQQAYDFSEEQNNEWNYEDANDEGTATYDDVLYAADTALYSPESFAQDSEIVLDTLPEFVLLGLEDENFRDPYIENSDNIR